MSRVAFVQLSTGGTLYHEMVDVPSDGGRWDASPAPAVALYDSSGGCFKTSTACDLGPTTTLNSAAAAKATELSLTATTGWERFFELWIGPNEDGRIETNTVLGVGGGKVQLASPLKYAYSTTNVVKSHRMSVTLSDGDLSSVQRNCRAEWRYTVDSTKRKASTVFHISRYAPALSLSAAEAMEMHPRFRKAIGSNQDPELVLRRLWERKVLPDIARQMPPGALVSGESAEEIMMEAVKVYAAAENHDWTAEAEYSTTYKNQLDQLQDTLIDMDEDGGQSDGERPQGAYTIRMVRC